MKTTIVTCMKNEGPFILEWIAYYRILGVTNFLVYTNDCTDGTEELLNALQAANIVTHLPNPALPGQPYQMTALKNAPHQKVVQDADWIFVCDVDEFLDIRVGEGRLFDLIENCNNPNAISVTMRMMANSGVKEFEDRPVISQFTKAHDPELWCDQRAIEVKTLTKKGFPLRYFGAHRPFVKHGFNPSEKSLHWTDGSGRQVPEAFVEASVKRRRHRFPAAGASQFASLNHYTLRSLESYLVKSHRGDVNREHRNFQLDYWEDRNDETWTETRILARLQQTLKEMAFLKTLPDVDAAHEEAVQRHKVLIDQLGHEPEFSALKEAILKISPSLNSPE